MTRRAFLLPILAALCVPALAIAAPAQDWAKAALEKSPRHREYVQVKAGARTVRTFVVYPESSAKAPVVVLIHEIFGLSDWAKSMADQIAAEGYIVVAPDLLSGTGPNGGGTEAYAGQDAVTEAVSGLPGDQVMRDLDAVADYGLKLPAANGKLAVAGFCWGGGKTFAFATYRKGLSGAFVFYGPPPPKADMAKIAAPVYGFYAALDARIDALGPATVADMRAAGKRYEPVTYVGAGHGFMRSGQAPDATPENKKARDEGFARLKQLLPK